MALALEALLRVAPEPTQRFLRAALDLEPPTVPALVAAGVPHYEATDYCRRLESAGEVSTKGWTGEARAAYSTLIIASVDAAARPARRLEHLSDQEQPREKALRSGIGALGDGELLALLLRTGVGEEGVLEFAERLLAEHDGLIGLAARDVEELVRARGLGPAKAGEIAAAFELGRRLAQARRRARPSLKTPEEVVALLANDLVSLPHEELWCLPLDIHSRLIGEPRIVSRGDVDGTDAGPRAFFRLALIAGATSCVAVHNHPSGDATPSNADRAVTRRLVAAGRAVDLRLVDHLIIGDDGRFTSLRRTEPELFA